MTLYRTLIINEFSLVLCCDLYRFPINASLNSGFDKLEMRSQLFIIYFSIMKKKTIYEISKCDEPIRKFEFHVRRCGTFFFFFSRERRGKLKDPNSN